MNTAKTLFDAASKGLRKHWPKIAIGVGSAFLFAGGYLLGREVPKYKKEVADKEEAAGEKLPVKEKTKIAVKHFVGPACTVAAGGLFIAASVCENEKRIRIGTTACAISELTASNLTTYKEAAKEIVGEEKEQEIEKKANEKKAEKAVALQTTPPPANMFWCFDIKHGIEPFPIESKTELQAAVNELQHDLLEMGYGNSVTLNDLLDKLRVPNRIKNDLAEDFDHIGWSYDDDSSHRKIDLDIGTMDTQYGPAYTIRPNAIIIDPTYFKFTTLDY